jgi:hypothetical protein
LPFLLAIAACADAPAPLPPDARPRLPAAAFDARLARVRELVLAAQEESAIAILEELRGEDLDARMRRDLAATSVEVQRSRFWREHPTRLAIAFDRPRHRYREPLVLTAEVFHFGAQPLHLVGSHVTWGSAFGFDAAERAVLELIVDRHECDAAGSRLVERRTYAAELPQTLEVGPGGVARVRCAVPLPVRQGSLFGTVAVTAVLRPVSIHGAGAAPRFDALVFGTARTTVVRRELERWFDAGLGELEGLLRPEPPLRPEALLLAACGLPEADLKAGLDRLIRATPSLDPPRQRLALAALHWSTGFDAASDPVRAVAWWDAEGRHLAPAELSRLRLRGGAQGSSLLAGGRPIH